MSDATQLSEVVVTPAKRPQTQSGVSAYAPQISVTLQKVVARDDTVSGGVDASPRVRGATGAKVDLTQYLGRGSTVTVRRTVRGADTGQFSVSFPDQMNSGFSDAVAAMVEPMDVIEIRMARDASTTGSARDGTKLPIVMRGFVSEVTRSEGMTEAGPVRTVTISGQGYMKILQIIRVMYLPTMIPGQDLLSSFKLFLNYGVETDGFQTAGEFVKKVVADVVGEFLARMQSGSGGDNSPVMKLQVDAHDSPSSGSVQPFGAQQWEGGSIYDLLAEFGDVGPWNELYVEDRDDGPYLVYRPTPFKEASGAYIQDGATANVVKIDASDLVAMTSSRTDANVANYYWVEAPRLSLVGSPLLQQDQGLSPPPALTDYQNSLPGMYGIRLMRQQSQQGVRYDGKQEDEVRDGAGVVIGMLNEKRRILIENNKDNVVFEAGAMTLKGSEKITAGSYIRLNRGGFESEMYAHEVTHQFTIGGAFLTSVSFDRGTGFIERTQRGTSAYLAELTIGGVYGR